MQNNNDWLGGYVRWFTDTPLSNGYPRTVIFPAADLMTVIDMGALGARRNLDGDDETNRGVGEMIFTPAFTSVAYTDDYQAEIVAEAQAPRLPHGRLARQRRDAAQVRGARRAGTRGQATFVDATEFIDRIKAIKSEEEID